MDMQKLNATKDRYRYAPKAEYKPTCATACHYLQCAASITLNSVDAASHDAVLAAFDAALTTVLSAFGEKS